MKTPTLDCKFCPHSRYRALKIHAQEHLDSPWHLLLALEQSISNLEWETQSLAQRPRPAIHSEKFANEGLVQSASHSDQLRQSLYEQSLKVEMEQKRRTIAERSLELEHIEHGETEKKLEHPNRLYEQS